MLLKTKTTVETDLEISIPIFWKDPLHDDYRAILNESTFVSHFRSGCGNYLAIRNCTPDKVESDILQAHTKWDKVTEAEFLSHYYDMYEALNLRPVESFIDLVKKVI